MDVVFRGQGEEDLLAGQIGENFLHAGVRDLRAHGDRRLRRRQPLRPANAILDELPRIENRLGPLLQVFAQLRAIGLQPPLDRLDDPPAADRADRRQRAQQEMIAGAGHHGRLGFHLDQARLAAFHRRARERIETGGHVGGAGVEADLRPAFQQQLFPRQQPQRTEIPLLGREEAGDGQHVAAADFAMVPMADVQGRALAGHHGLAGLAINFDPPDSPGEPLGQ